MTPALPPPAAIAPAPPPAVASPAPDPSAPPPAPASAVTAPNAIYLEVLGNGLLYSVNYERLLPQWNVGLRAGVSFIAYKISSAQGAGDLELASAPFVASWYWGTPDHKLQLGLGACILYVKASTDSTGVSYSGSVSGLGLAATGVVGYRYLPHRGGFTFGIGFTPLVRTTKGFLPWGGASVGIAF